MRAGIILMMDRTFDARQNAIIVEKAVRYAARGIVGIDIAGPRPTPARTPTATSRRWSQRPARRGLGVTVHVGEEGYPEEIAEVVEVLAPDRIGHGILAAQRPELTALLAERGIVLEICPTSNLLTKALRDADAVRETFRTFLEAGVRVTVSTDGPEMMRTHLRDEFAFLSGSEPSPPTRPGGERAGPRLVVRPPAGRRDPLVAQARPGMGGEHHPAPLVEHPGLGQAQPEPLDPAVLLDLVNHHREQHRGAAGRDDFDLLQLLAAPANRAARVAGDVLLAVEDVAAKARPAQVGVQQLPQRRRIAGGSPGGTRPGGRQDVPGDAHSVVTWRTVLSQRRNVRVRSVTNGRLSCRLSAFATRTLPKPLTPQ